MNVIPVNPTASPDGGGVALALLIVLGIVLLVNWLEERYGKK